MTVAYSVGKKVQLMVEHLADRLAAMKVEMKVVKKVDLMDVHWVVM